MKSFVQSIRPLVYSLLSLLIVAQSTTAWANPQVAESDSPGDALRKSFAALSHVKSYRLRAQRIVTGPDVKYPEMMSVLEYVAPDRFRIVEESREHILIGRQVFRKNGDGSWRRLPEEVIFREADFFWPDIARKDTNEIPIPGDVKLVGKEALDGVPTLVYEYGTTRRWIAEADGLPRRIQFTSPLGSGTVIFTFFDYNADIKIEPPEGAEPAPPSPGGVSEGVPEGRGDRNAIATAVDQKPVPLNSPQPSYTKAARDNKVEGTVILRVLVDVDGKVKQARIVRGLPDGLDEQAIHAVYQLHFRPAMKDGRPVAFWVPVAIEFNLK